MLTIKDVLFSLDPKNGKLTVEVSAVPNARHSVSVTLEWAAMQDPAFVLLRAQRELNLLIRHFSKPTEVT